jgi:hypothetical protein
MNNYNNIYCDTEKETKMSWTKEVIPEGVTI